MLVPYHPFLRFTPNPVEVSRHSRVKTNGIRVLFFFSPAQETLHRSQPLQGGQSSSGAMPVWGVACSFPTAMGAFCLPISSHSCFPLLSFCLLLP